MIVEKDLDARNDHISDNTKEQSNHRLTAFAFHGTENGIDIKIIGCLEVRGAPSQPVYSKGLVQICGKVFSIFENDESISYSSINVIPSLYLLF